MMFTKNENVRLVCEKCKGPAELELSNVDEGTKKVSAAIRCLDVLYGHTIFVGGVVKTENR